jgi:hypothetical protein
MVVGLWGLLQVEEDGTSWNAVIFPRRKEGGSRLDEKADGGI